MSERHGPQPIEVNELTPETKKSMATRTVVALALVAIIVPALFFGSWVFFTIAAVFLALAIYEIMVAPGKKYHWWVWVVTFLIVLSYVYWFVIKANLWEWKHNPDTFAFSLENYYSGLEISIFSIATAVIIYFLIAILDKSFSFSDVAYFITMTLILGLGFQALMLLRFYPFYMFGHNSEYSDAAIWGGIVGSNFVETGFWDYGQFKYLGSTALIFYVLIATVMNDTFAYFGGVLFGKHKMNPRVSPKKTWEGFFLGWFFGTALSLTFGLVLDACGYPLLPTLTIDRWYYILILSLALPLLADLGDLAFSLVKRSFGIKDFGTLLPGHGGILDRIDSVIFASIGAAMLIIIISHGWDFTV
jgi:CDP-diglyceride synthetase